MIGTTMCVQSHPELEACDPAREGEGVKLMRGMRICSCLAIFLLCAAAKPQSPTAITTTNGGTAGAIPVFTSGTNVENSVITQSNGNVGIGTTTPHGVLDAEGNSNGLLRSYFLNNSTGTDARQDLQVGVGNSSLYLGVDKAAALYGGTSYGYLDNRSGGKFTIGFVGTPQLTIDTGGKVGIGTTNPSETLEVKGNIKLTANSGASITFQDGTTQTTAFNPALCGGDYAESVDVTGKRTAYEPGDVLVIDPDTPGKFLKAGQPYSTLVAGVYSTKPGTVGRRQTTPKSPDEVPMAVVGIVPVKVTAENGPIKPGDLLVTSSTPGRAMKGTDHGQLLGAVVGKALGSLDSGDGVVEVLVSLR